MPQASTKEKPGKTGAKVTSFDENAARVYVKRVMDQHPAYSREQIVAKVRQLVLPKHLSGDSKYLPAFVDYATINAWRAVKLGETSFDPPAPTPSKDHATEPTGKATPGQPRPVVPIKSAAELEDERHQAELRRIASRDTAKQNVKAVLLNLVAPNGKLWRELTLLEYGTFGQRQHEHYKAMIAAGHTDSELLDKATSDAEIDAALNK